MFRCEPPPGSIAVWIVALAIGSFAHAQSDSAAIAELRREFDRLEGRFGQQLIQTTAADGASLQLTGEFQQLAERLDQLAGRITRGDDRQQALYLAAWSHYYAGISSDTATRSRELEAAQARFKEFLDLADVDHDQWTAELIGLDHEGMCLGLYGLAMAEMAAGEDARAARNFALLESPLVPAEIRKEWHVWQVRGALYAGRKDLLGRNLARMVDAIEGDPDDAALKVCAQVAIGALRPGTSLPRSLGFTALRALWDWGRTDYVKKIVWDLNDELVDAPDELRLLAAKMFFHRAHEAGTRDEYARALALLQTPLNKMWSGGMSELTIECRYLVAFCFWQLQQFEKAAAEAARCIDAVAERRKFNEPWQPLRPLVEKAAALQLAALFKISRYAAADEKQRIVEALQRVQADAKFFGAENAEKAAYELTRLQQDAATPEQMIAWLRQIKPTSSMYRNALFDMTTVRYLDWRDSVKNAAGDNGGGGTKKFQLLREMVEEYWSKTARDENASHDVQVIARMTDAALDPDRPQPDLAEQWLNKINEIPADVRASVSHEHRVDYVLLQLRLAEARGQPSVVQERARWLAQNAKGSAAELKALNILCQRWIDSDLNTLSDNDRQLAAAHFQRLLERLQELSDQQNKPLFEVENAEPVAWKHSEIARAAGQYAEAAATADLLAAAFPARVPYVRQAAQLHYLAENFAASCEHWRNLSRRLDEDRDGNAWYEAKYYLIECLSRTDKSAAREVLDQLLALYAPIRSETWKPKFDELQQSLAPAP